MRSGCILALVSLLGACEGAATPVRGPAPGPTASATAQAVPSAGPSSEGIAEHQNAPPAGSAAVGATGATASTGHLLGTGRLAHVFEALAALEDGHAHDDVRILQYGDSHTASDMGVSAFRHAMQSRFGDGGRGFVAVGKPWRTYSQEGVHTGMEDGFANTRSPGHKGVSVAPALEGHFGLLGIGVVTGRAHARAWSEVSAQASRVELAYAEQPAGGSFDVFVDGTRTAHVSTQATDTKSGWSAFEVPDASHRVEVRTVGDGDVLLYGMNLDRSAAGVVVDTLGIDGAQVFTPLRWNEDHFTEQLRHAAPDLVVLAYGTNESMQPGLTDAAYERAIVDMLGRIARATPTASCLLLGPPDMARHTKGHDDWYTWGRIGEIIAVQKRVADAAGCAFFDQREAMGGPGSIIQWAIEPEPRANFDRVHLRRSGYTQLGTSFATDLMRAYDEWRAERGLAPADAGR
ncbi:MAG TPA: GDSL-type esterase/lipase family protein [Polyangiaceae bacterium]